MQTRFFLRSAARSASLTDHNSIQLDSYTWMPNPLQIRPRVNRRRINELIRV